MAKLDTDLRNTYVPIALALCFYGGTMMLSIGLQSTHPKDINWQTTPVTGTILGTSNTSSSRLSNTTVTIYIKLDSGETISIIDRGEMPVIVRGKKVILNRGTTKKGKNFYRLPHPYQEK